MVEVVDENLPWSFELVVVVEHVTVPLTLVKVPLQFRSLGETALAEATTIASTTPTASAASKTTIFFMVILSRS